MPLTKNEIEIKPIGSYFQIDKDGFIVNPTSLENLQPDWKPAINSLVDIYKAKHGDKLVCVYIRGSVAKGEAVKDISDLDSFAYVKLKQEEIKSDWISKAEQELITKYPFITKIEIDTLPVSKAFKNIVILNQSLCVYGDPLDVPKLKPGKEMAIHAPRLEKRMSRISKNLEAANDEAKIKRLCVQLMKTILRTGFEITMERSKKYTRDLYPCYETFSEYYPEKESQMKEVLCYALNPSSDKSKIKKIFNDMGDWLLEEKKNYF